MVIYNQYLQGDQISFLALTDFMDYADKWEIYFN